MEGIVGRPKVIALLSGKGGCGKTAMAITMCSLLEDVGRRSILVDFDLATHGAAYFFLGRLHASSHELGIWELLRDKMELGKRLESKEINSAAYRLPVPAGQQPGTGDTTSHDRKTKPQRHVLASRVRFGADEKDVLKGADAEIIYRNLLAPLLDWCIEERIEYVILDCPAGVSTMSGAAALAVRRAHLHSGTGVLLFALDDDDVSREACIAQIEKLGDDVLVKADGGERRDDFYYMYTKLHTSNPLSAELCRLGRGHPAPPSAYDHLVRAEYGRSEVPSSPLYRRLLSDTMNHVLHDEDLRHDLKRYWAPSQEGLAMQRRRLEDLEEREERIHVALKDGWTRTRFWRNLALVGGAMWTVTLLGCALGLWFGAAGATLAPVVLGGSVVGFCLLLVWSWAEYRKSGILDEQARASLIRELNEIRLEAVKFENADLAYGEAKKIPGATLLAQDDD